MTSRALAAVNRRERIRRLLRDHPYLTQRAVAMLCGVSKQYVATVKREAR